MKKMLSLFALVVLALFVAGAAVADLDIDSVSYQGKGVVRVVFEDDDDDDYVVYKKPKVKVTDDNGVSYTAKITKKNKRFMVFKISNPASGKRYSFTITGIRERGDDDFDTVNGSFSIASVEMPKISAVAYKGNGKVEVSFSGNQVQYKNVKVSASDSQGNSYTAKVVNKGNKSLVFKVENVRANTSYNFTISGIGSRGAGEYGTLSGSFNAPSLGDVQIKKIDYDSKGKLDVEFTGKVSYQNLSVIAKAGDGKVYNARVKDKDNDELELVISGIVEGRNAVYTLEISGVSVR
ncbi:MAG: hypothetical protein Q4D04_06700, partial [Clostridia bacterium]|nr:hypothetical protein [Clostridia bacterium]